MKNCIKKSLKGSNGITLIALVITIIVLLILAGVSIAMLSGDNSILKNSQKPADDTKLANAKEEAVVKMQEVVTEYYQKKYSPKDGDTDPGTLSSFISTNFGSEYQILTDAETGDSYIELPGGVTGAIDANGKITWSDE